MVKVKIDDKEVWEKEVKDNKRFGFSIEGLLEHKLVTLASVGREYTIDDLELEDLLEIFEIVKKVQCKIRKKEPYNIYEYV